VEAVEPEGLRTMRDRWKMFFRGTLCNFFDNNLT